MQVKRHVDIHAIAQEAARLISEDCEQALLARPRPYTLGLSGGRTPRLMFEALAEMPIPWPEVHIVQVDERVAPLGSADRNFTQLVEGLLARVDIPSENVHAMPVESDDLAAACERYEADLRAITHGAPLDMLQLGLGDDGHTASLAPGDPVLEVADRNIWYVEGFNGLARMTMTYPLLDGAHRLLWLASGATKAEMCRRLVAADIAIPAGRVKQGNAILLVDDDAGVDL